MRREPVAFWLRVYIVSHVTLGEIRKLRLLRAATAEPEYARDLNEALQDQLRDSAGAIQSLCQDIDRYLRRRVPAAIRFLSSEPLIGALPDLDLAGLDWVIVGGESGHGARPMDVDWVRDLRDRSLAAGVAFFFKQWGGRTPKAGGRALDGRTWDQMPTDRVPLTA